MCLLAFLPRQGRQSVRAANKTRGARRDAPAFLVEYLMRINTAVSYSLARRMHRNFSIMIEFGCKTEYQAPFGRYRPFWPTRRVGHKLSLIFGFRATIGEPLELITMAAGGDTAKPARTSAQ